MTIWLVFACSENLHAIFNSRYFPIWMEKTQPSSLKVLKVLKWNLYGFHTVPELKTLGAFSTSKITSSLNLKKSFLIFSYTLRDKTFTGFLTSKPLMVWTWREKPLVYCCTKSFGKSGLLLINPVRNLISEITPNNSYVLATNVVGFWWKDNYPEWGKSLNSVKIFKNNNSLSAC